MTISVRLWLHLLGVVKDASPLHDVLLDPRPVLPQHIVLTLRLLRVALLIHPVQKHSEFLVSADDDVLRNVDVELCRSQWLIRVILPWIGISHRLLVVSLAYSQAYSHPHLTYFVVIDVHPLYFEWTRQNNIWVDFPRCFLLPTSGLDKFVNHMTLFVVV